MLDLKTTQIEAARLAKTVLAAIDSMGDKAAEHVLRHSVLRWDPPALATAFWRCIAHARPEPGQAIVEIGTFHGATAALLGLIARDLCPGVKVWTVDVNGASSLALELWRILGVRHPLDQSGNVLARLGRAEAVLGDPSWPGGGLPVAVAFVDGDHGVDAVAREWALLAPRLTPRGVVLFDDVNYSRGPGAFLRGLDGFHDEGRLGWIANGKPTEEAA